jgi:hypothetical protein
MTNIWSSNIVIKTLRIIFDDNFTIAFTFVFSFDKFPLNIIIAKRFDKWTEFFLLIVSSRSSRIDEDRRTDDSDKNFWFFKFPLVYVKSNEKIKINSLVIISSWRKFYCTKIDLSVYHFHLTLSSDSHVNKSHPISFLILSIFFNSKNLSLLSIKIYIKIARRKQEVFCGLVLDLF